MQRKVTANDSLGLKNAKHLVWALSCFVDIRSD